MPKTDEILARAGVLPQVFTCAAAHGGLDAVDASVRARKAGRRLILVRGRPDIHRVFRLTGSFAEIDGGDPDRELQPMGALQRSLVARSLLKSG